MYKVLSDEQVAIVDRAAQVQGNVLVQALAGCRKTSTLQEIGRSIPNKYILYCAFNKDAQVDASKSGLTNVEYRTFHSLAYAATGINKYYRNKNGFSIKVPGARLCKMLGFDPELGIGLVKDCLSMFCQSADRSVGWQHVRKSNLLKFNPEDRDSIRSQVISATRQLYARSVDYKDRDIYITPQVYLKKWHLSGGKLPVVPDMALIDEAQDLSPVILDIAKGWGIPTVYVGDPNQSIYAFTGAVDAMNHVDGDLYYLTHCSRFGENIADLNNNILSYRGGVPKMKGNPGKDSEIVWNHKLLPDKYTVLCRTNAGLMDEVMDAISNGKKTSVVGNMAESIDLMQSTYGLMYGKPEMITHKEIQLLGTVDALFEAAETEYDIGNVVKRVRELGDNTLDMCRSLKSITSSEDCDVLVSTAHKSKGREWDVVKLASDFRSPLKGTQGANGKLEVKSEELNLTYVSCTRARKVLFPNTVVYAMTKGASL